MRNFVKNKQYFKFCFYGFFKNLRFFDAFFILFLLEKGLSYTEIGILYAVRELFIQVFEIPSGIIADTFGRKKSLLGSFVAYIVSFLVFYYSDHFLLFLIAFIFYGLGDAFRTGTHKGMIMDYLKLNHWEEQKINYYGHTRSWSQKGSALSSLIAGLIVFYSGKYQSIFLYSVVPYLLNFLLILSYPKELDNSINQNGSKGKYDIRSTFVSFFKIIRQPNVLKIINSSALHTAYLRTVKDYIQPLMVNVALIIPILVSIETEKKNGLIIGVIYFFIYLLTSTASMYSSKVANSSTHVSTITLLMGFIFGTLCGVLFIFNLWVITLIAFVGIYIVENIRKPILTGFVADNVPNEILTSVISAQSLLKTILTVILSLIFGVVADAFGIGVSLVTISVFLALSTVIINISGKKKNIILNY